MFALSPRMRRTKGQRGVLALALCVGVSATTTSGCSFLFVDAPPANAKHLNAFSCTTSNALPITDGVIAGLAVVDTAEFLLEGTSTIDAQGNLTKKPDYGAAVGSAAVAALFAASSVVGHSHTTECKEATADLMTRLYPSGAPGFAPQGPGYAPSPGFTPYPYAPPPQPYDPWTAPPPGGAPRAPGAAPPPAPGAAPPPAPGAAPPPPPAAGPWGAPAPSRAATPPPAGGGDAKP